MIGIIVAMESELKPYLDKIDSLKKEKIGQKDFFSGKIGDKEVAFVLSGIGKVNAAYAATLMINRYKPEFIISTGVSGGLGRTDIMEIVVAEKVVQHDCDTTAFGDPIGFVSTIDKVFFETDKVLSKKFLEIMSAHSGIVACGDQFVANETKAREIVKNFDAIACDMESGAIGQIAYIENVSFVVLRCVSDSAHESAEVSFNDVVVYAASKLSEAVVRVIKQL